MKMKHMKANLLNISLFFMVFIFCCGKTVKDKSAQLADLKKEQADINQKVAHLELEIGTGNTKRVTDVSAPAVKPSTFTSYIEVQGLIDADENVTANAEAPGIITAIYVAAGQSVKKGQVLAQLDYKALEQQILQVQSQADLATVLFLKQKNLWDQNIGTEVQFLQAQSNRDIVLKQLSALKAQASMYKIVAPISGILDQMDLKVGQAVQPGMAGIRIVNLANLKVKAAVPESYAESIQKGDRVMVTVPGASDSLETIIAYASKVIEPTSRSYTVEVKLPSKPNLKPNMTVVLRIVNYEKQNALILPMKAVHSSEEGNYVFIAQNNIAKRVEVKIGKQYQGRVEIVSGIRDGDQVVIEGTENIEDGDQLKIADKIGL